MPHAPCHRRHRALPLSLVCLLTVAAPALAAPTISNISLRGLQSGATTTLVVDGNELLPDPRVLLTAPIAKQTVKPGATAQRLELEITLDVATPSGTYLLRLASASGVSNALAIGIDPLPQTPYAPQVAALPASLTGALGGGSVLSTTFNGKKGSRVVVELEARRLGANFNPVLHLLDARRVQLAWSQGQAAIGGDARCDQVLPADGVYTVELHDALYRGGDPGFFRLKIGELSYADMVFPLGVQVGSPATLGYVSTSLAESAQVAGLNFMQPGVQPAVFPLGVALLSGSRPRLMVSDYVEVIEAAPLAGQVQELPAAPVAINGRIGAAGEQDRYKIPVTPGQQLRFDVLASRFGSTLDGVLAVLNEQGAQLATNDDRPGTSDPGLDFTVPAGVNAIVVSLRDLRGEGGPRSIYRVSVVPVARPDFSLAISEDRVLIPAGGSSVTRVRAVRNGYNGPIKLAVAGLPATVLVANQEIPAGVNEALLSFTAQSADLAQVITSIVGESTEPQTPLKRVAQVDENAITRQQPWLRNELAVAVTPAGPLTVAWDGMAPDAKLTAGSPLGSKVKITRAAGLTGVVRLVLVTTQAIPKKTVKVNNQDQQVDDVDRSLRLEGAPMIAADQTESATNLLAPADLPAAPYDAMIRAELLSADGKTVIAAATTAARRLPTIAPPKPAG